MKKYTTFFEDLIKVFASISLILVIAGYLDLKSYYSYFGINISPYLNASEILISSLDNLTIVVISLIIQLLIWLSFFKYLFEFTEDDINKYWVGKVRPKESSNDLTIIRFLGNKRIKVFTLMLLSVFVVSIILKLIFPKNDFILQLGLFLSINIWLFMLIYMGWLPLTRVLIKIAKNQEHYSPRLIVSVIVFLPTFLIAIWIKNAMFLGNRVRKHGNKEKIELVLQNNIRVSTNDSIRYIGRTENYIFFWNKNSWASTIYPSSEVKEIINFKQK